MEYQRLVQLIHTDGQRRVALVREPELILIRYFSSVFALAKEALERSLSLIHI